MNSLKRQASKAERYAKLRDNVDQVPGGINLSEACSTGSARS